MPAVSLGDDSTKVGKRRQGFHRDDQLLHPAVGTLGEISEKVVVDLGEISDRWIRPADPSCDAEALPGRLESS